MRQGGGPSPPMRRTLLSAASAKGDRRPMRAWTRLAAILERLRSQGTGSVLARGAGAFLVIHVLGVGVSFLVHVLLARTLGAESYGAYVYAFSWMLLLLLLCRVGLGTASLRFVAALSARGEWALLKGFLRASRAIVLVASLAVAGATALVVRALGDTLSEATRETLLVCCLCMPVFALLQLGTQALRGFQRVLLSQVPTMLLQPILLGAAILLVWLAAPLSLDAPRAMWLTLVSALGGLALAAFALRAATPPEVRAARSRLDMGVWMRAAAPLMLFNVLNVALERTDVLLVGSLLGEAEVGVYASASRIATVISFGLAAVSAWAAPLISGHHARGDREAMQRLVRASARSIFAFTLPLAIAVIAAGAPLLSLFGPGFERAYPSLVILSCGQLVSALAGPVGFLMTMTGRQNLAAAILAAHAALLVALSVLLIPRLGIEGAAVSTALTRASWNVVMALAVWRQLRLRSTIF